MSSAPEWAAWLASRPPIIRARAEQYPPGCVLVAQDGSRGYVVSYYEDGGLGASRVNPAEDYEGAMATRYFVCRDHLAPLPIGVP